MHDPSTVAFDIKYPVWQHKPWPKGVRSWDQMEPAQREGRSQFARQGYRNTFITIWHEDPERDGSDDSCGWSYPKLTKEQIARLNNAAWGEAHNPYFLRCRGKAWTGTRHEAECLYRGLILRTAAALDISLSFDDAAKAAALEIHRPDCTDSAGAFCFLPGYHTNFEEDTADRRQEHFHGVLCGIARNLLRERRPWYRHPKWHVWHWRIQVHPLQQFKRWAFSRCRVCGGRFRWGESPMSNCWHGAGPRWFRGEPDVSHCACANTQLAQNVPSPAQV